MIQTCANCGGKINDPLGTFTDRGKGRKCPHCGKNFDIEDLVDGEGRVNLAKFMREKKR